MVEEPTEAVAPSAARIPRALGFLCMHPGTSGIWRCMSRVWMKRHTSGLWHDGGTSSPFWCQGLSSRVGTTPDGW